jgi:SagB-type dehydrogenase family enzyme
MEAISLRSEGDLEGSAMLALHRASACAAPRPAVAKGGERAVSDRSIRLLAPPADLAARIPHAIARRRSARAYGGAPVPLAKLGHALDYAFAHLATRDAGLLRAHLVATRVEGLDAGVYEVEGAGEALLPLALGDCAARLRDVTLGQEIAERCAAVLFLSAPAGAACALWGDRAYRYLHLEAGVLGERLQLAATALDLAACGIAGFFDDPAASLIGIPPDDFLLYLITIGSGS